MASVEPSDLLPPKPLVVSTAGAGWAASAPAGR